MQGTYFSVSGIGTARTSRLYHRLKDELRGNPRFVFIDNPFRGNPHPLMWDAEERALNPSTRLLKSWATLNEVVCSQLRPALERGSVVITHRFGLDALLYAIANAEQGDDNFEAERVHHALVQLRIVQQKVKPPIYLIPRVEDLKSVKADWLEHSPALRGIDPKMLCDFLKREEQARARYFDPRHGQNKPIYLEASDPLDVLCRKAIQAIETTLAARAAA